MGTTIREKNVPKNRPPMITQPIWLRPTEPGPEENASGMLPKIMALVVIRIGRKRIVPALTMAFSNGIP